MTSAEARDLANKQNARGWVFDIVDALAALESFCEGLKGVNDDLRGKLAECEKERDEAKDLNVYFRDAVGECHLMISRNTSAYQVRDKWEPSDLPPRLQKVMSRSEAAEEDVRILTEASRANEDMIERARGSVPVERLEALAASAEKAGMSIYGLEWDGVKAGKGATRDCRHAGRGSGGREAATPADRALRDDPGRRARNGPQGCPRMVGESDHPIPTRLRWHRGAGAAVCTH